MSTPKTPPETSQVAPSPEANAPTPSQESETSTDPKATLRVELIAELNYALNDLIAHFPDSATIIRVNRIREIATTL